MAAKVLTEFLGTMFLCLTVATAGRFGANAPVAIGGVLMVLVYAGGHVSGAHYNPAVTLALYARKGEVIGRRDAAVYIVSQLVGAWCGAFLAWVLIGPDGAAHALITKGVDTPEAFLCEAMMTFALCSVVLHTATTKAQEGNSHYGLAIGFTVLSGAVSVGGHSGGAFNPAVGSMSLLYGEHTLVSVLVYWAAPVFGGLAAATLFNITLAWQESADSKAAWLAPCLVELIGTMMLCFTVGTAASQPTPLTALAIGSMLMAMIYMGGYISGAHYNPAVTLAILCRSLFGALKGPFTLSQAARYVASQLTGAALGTAAAQGALRQVTEVGHPALPEASHLIQGLLAELLGTCLLAYVVLNVATVKKVAGNSYFGLAIGMVVTSMACALGPVSGGAFNPAVGTMGLFLHGLHRQAATNLWLYWFACPLGGVLAALCFSLQNFQEFTPPDLPRVAAAAEALVK